MSLVGVLHLNLFALACHAALNKLQVEWGEHSVTAAMRLLLAAAVADSDNQRFVFLDETTLPLYPPPLVWAQLMGEAKTRMAACEVSSSFRTSPSSVESVFHSLLTFCLAAQGCLLEVNCASQRDIRAGPKLVASRNAADIWTSTAAAARECFAQLQCELSAGRGIPCPLRRLAVAPGCRWHVQCFCADG